MVALTPEQIATMSGSGMTARAVITQSLRLINKLAVDEDPSSAVIEDTLYHLNSMLNGWLIKSAIKTHTAYGIGDIVTLDIGATDRLAFNDVVVYNLASRLIEVYNLEPRSFGFLVKKATDDYHVLFSFTNTINAPMMQYDQAVSQTPDILYGTRRSFYG